MKIPKPKKKISSYILGEEGKISKQALIKVGSVLGVAALGSAIVANKVGAGTTHSNALNFYEPGSDGVAEGTAKAVHTHHASHSSY